MNTHEFRDSMGSHHNPMVIEDEDQTASCIGHSVSDNDILR